MYKLIVFLLFYLGICLCVLALSIPTDAAKKKLLKKLAKELGYKLEDAIFKNIGDTVDDLNNENDKNGDAITKLAETNKNWFHATRYA